ncbi:Gfo/Idh/MocA family oxidoreductase [Gracilibacillus salinarum]|uniref:Gfo/Idh/MocA family oxidoreductase n=1 Tax=Gracilibacillus salinarum TaxID=2932255 RepID=A0ABY4GSP4_9BACI|nr:Gfo/Idh/MocA family oxidoreductase [Gracilibacillus salinarum]UOQ86990.1 Gfo/Idh/MocA family oxidoreductase [Gracilibacillus salinarum]
MMNIAIIGYGNAVLNYHLPYLERRETINVKYIFRREEDRVKEGTEHENWYPSIRFTTNLDDILHDTDIDLVVICTHVDSHVEYATRALENSKHVLVEKPFAPTIEEANQVFDLAKSKGLIAMANQNRRFDGDFLTLKKVLESGKLGNIIEIQSHYDYFMPQFAKKGNYGFLYGLAVHTIDQIISVYGKPDDIHYDVRSAFYPGESDDYIDIDFYFGRTKVTVKSSIAVKLEHPKFTVHGDKGSFIKYSSGHQKKNPDGPTQVNFEVEPESNWGSISYIDEKGKEYEERVPSEITDYGILYEKLYQAINNNGEKPVKDEEVVTVLHVLENGLAVAKNTK